MAQKKKATAASKATSAKSAKAKVASARVKSTKGAVKAKVASTAKVKATKPAAAKTATESSKKSKVAKTAVRGKPAKAAPATAKRPASSKPATATPVRSAAAAAKTGDRVKSAKPASAAAKRKTVAASKPTAAPKSSATKAVAAKVAAEREAAAAPRKPVNQRHGFKANEFVVYPAHGVGRIVGIEEQEIAGMSLELFVITFDKEKLTLRVPTGKLESVGMRKLADETLVKKAMDTLKGRARVKRTMWSRRAQEYVAKINSGDLISIAEVVRDLYRSEAQPEQSYSERQLYEDALDRMSRELAAVERLDDRGAVQRIVEVLSKSAKSRRVEAEGEAADEAAA